MWRAALRLAPCLRAMDLCGVDLQAAASVLSSSTCVVAKLKLDVMKYESEALAAAIIHKISALGGLTELELRIYNITIREDPLLSTVYGVNHLRDENWISGLTRMCRCRCHGLI